MAGMWCNGLAKLRDLPQRFCGLGHCFRGKQSGRSPLELSDQRTQIDLFAVCQDQKSEAELEGQIEVLSGMYKELGLHFRVVEAPAARLDLSATRGFEIAVWMPSLKDYVPVFVPQRKAVDCGDAELFRLPERPTQRHLHRRAQ